VNVGDMVTTLYDSGQKNKTVGIVLSPPRVIRSHNGVDVRVVEVEWIGWNIREDYSYPHLEVIAKAKDGG